MRIPYTHQFQAHVLERLVPSSQHCFGRVQNFVRHTVTSHLTYLLLSHPLHNEQWATSPQTGICLEGFLQVFGAGSKKSK